MRIGIIGGKLQGVEAVYLAKKAGWETFLFDRREEAQASLLADHFICLDVLVQKKEFIASLKGLNLLLPAIEDLEVLNFLREISAAAGIPLAFDLRSYQLSSSKVLSNRFFAELDIPRPQPWPNCDFPLLVKPSGASGSAGVRLVRDKQELQEISAAGEYGEMIAEEYLEGPSFSLEVIGYGGRYEVFQITELEMDEDYDCKRVLAPAELNESLRRQFELIGRKLAQALSLQGIMDIETILHKGRLKVLEIDARLPSQTPITVYHSTGINLVERLGRALARGELAPPAAPAEETGVIYEHLAISPEKIETRGEHILAQGGPLRLYEDFWGADEALTDYAPGRKEWNLTLIIRAKSRQDAWRKRNQVLRQLQENFRIPRLLDAYPLNPLRQTPADK